MGGNHSVSQRVLQPFAGRRKLVFWTKMYASGPFSCRVSSNKGIHKITVYNIIWDKVADPVLQFMDTEQYFKISHERELKVAIQEMLLELVAPNLDTYEGMVKINNKLHLI